MSLIQTVISEQIEQLRTFAADAAAQAAAAGERADALQIELDELPAG